MIYDDEKAKCPYCDSTINTAKLKIGTYIPCPLCDKKIFVMLREYVTKIKTLEKS